MVDIKVVNIVASATFAEKLDLDMIAQSQEETEYEPEQFPGLVYRVSNPKTDDNKTDKYIALLRDGVINKEDFMRLIASEKKQDSLVGYM